MIAHTVRFHRVLRATPERIYRAFLDADAMVKWLPPNGFTGKVHHLDATVTPSEACYLGWQDSSSCWHNSSRPRFPISDRRPM